MAGTVVADTLQAASTSTLVLKNGVANTPPTVQDSAGTEIGTFCRAWVNFNGTGAVAIRADFNVTDITDSGTGTYVVNISNPLPDENYSATVCAGSGTTSSTTLYGFRIAPAPTASEFGFQIYSTSTTATLNDPSYVTAALFR